MPNLSDWSIEYNRSGPFGASFTPSACGLTPVVLTIGSRYLGAREGGRNEAASPFGRDRNRIMSTFDKRQEGFEKKYALDEEQKFKAEARRNKLLGLWAAEKLGMSADEAAAYAKEVVASDFEESGDADVVRKVLGDLTAKGVAMAEPELRVKMDELMAMAVVQVKAGT